jgi:hypothetical protein
VSARAWAALAAVSLLWGIPYPWTGSVAYPWQERVKRRRLSRQTLAMVRRDGRWIATAFPNTRVKPISREGVGFSLATRFIRWRAARARRGER